MTGENSETVAGTNYYIGTLVWSPDSRYIARGSNDVEGWEAATGKLLSRYSNEYRYGVDTLDWSPDGRLIVFEAGYVQLWVATTGKPFSRTTRRSATILRWSPDVR